jgi:O-antigen/teichoic acid export membrane protein
LSEPVDRAASGGLTGGAASDVATVARGGAVQIAGQVSQRGLTFLFTVVAARLLLPAGLGLYRQAAQILAIGGQLGLAGYNYAAMRFITKARAAQEPAGVRGAARVAVTGSLVASAAVVMVMLLAAEEIARAFVGTGGGEAEEGSFAFLLRIGAAYVPFFAVTQVLRYCTQAYRTMVPSVIVGNIIQPSVRFVVGVAALLAGFAVTGAVTTLVVSYAVSAVAGVWFFRRMLTDDERVAAPRFETGAMTRFALPQAGASLLGIQSLGLGIIVLGLVLDSDVPVGLFSVALALQAPGGVFLSGIVNIWAPVVSDLHERGEMDRLDSLYKTITRWVVTFAFPVYAVLIIMPELFVRLVAGPRYADAASLVAVLALGNIFYSGTGPTGYVISMTGRPGINFANSVVGVGAYALAGFVFVPRYGVIAMAWIDALITTLINMVRVIEAKLLVGVQPFGRSFLKPVAATAVAAGALVAWKLALGDALLPSIIGLIVAGALYLLVLRVLGIDPEERYVWDRIRTRAFKSRGRKSSRSEL